MEYEIRELNLGQPETNQQVSNLLRLTFSESITSEKLKLNTSTSKGKSLYIGAFKDNELAGFNAFIQHDLYLNNVLIEAYQSCWSATHPQHRGKGIFYSIINEAKVLLKKREAGFIFGFPNANSHPIFIKKLGFKEVPLVKVQAPVIGFSIAFNFLLKRISATQNFNYSACILCSEPQQIELKRQEFGNDIKVFSSYNNSLWGKKRVKHVKGFKLNYFSVGGLIVNKPHLLYHVFHEMLRTEKVHYVEIIGASSNSYFNFFKNVKAAPLTEPLIVFDLNFCTDATTKFNLFTGIKDVF